MKEIIVSGATGFIGSHFVKELIENGIKVISLGRVGYDELPEHTKKRITGSSYINIDLDSILDLQSQIDCINENKIERYFFHLGWGGETQLSDLSVEHQMKNVSRSVNAMTIAKNIGCKKFIHLGTMEEAFTEEYLSMDYKNTSKYNRHVIYAVAKLTAHKALKIKSKELDMSFIYVSHSHVMGPYDKKDSLLQVTIQNIIDGNDMIFSSGEQLWDVISVHDCAYGFRKIVERGRSGAKYWVGSGDPQTLKKYIERIFKVFTPKGKYEFGKLPYNDVKLNKETFDTSNLINDCNFSPRQTFEDAVIELYEHLMRK